MMYTFAKRLRRGDRLIAATAAHLDCPLLANDPVIARVPTVTTIW